MVTSSLLRKLEGGDRRSIGRADEVVAAVLRQPRLFGALFAGLSVEDSVVRAPALRPAVRRQLQQLTATGTPAMRARGSKLLAELKGRGQAT